VSSNADVPSVSDRVRKALDIRVEEDGGEVRQSRVGRWQSGAGVLAVDVAAIAAATVMAGDTWRHREPEAGARGSPGGAARVTPPRPRWWPSRIEGEDAGETAASQTVTRISAEARAA